MQNIHTSITLSLTTLFDWADKNNISEELFPREEAQLLSITELKLHDLDLTTVPAEIGLLVNLKCLYLSSNQLVSLPKEIGQLHNLEKLWIHNNVLTAMPDEVLNLTNLIELAAFSNELTEFPAELMNMPKLKWLFIQDNFLDVDSPMFESVPNTLNLATYGQKQFVQNKRFYITALYGDRLPEAKALRDRIFKGMTQDEKPSLDASLDRKAYQDWYEENGIDRLDYWVLIERSSDKVVGLTGIYTEKQDAENTCWLGWFCIDPAYRKHGLGRALLDFSITKAKSLKKELLKLYTYNSKGYHDAMKMYEKYGFSMFEPHSGESRKKDVFMELDFKTM